MIELADAKSFPEHERFAVIKYMEERGAFLIVIARRDGELINVLNVGVELTAHAAEVWARTTVNMMNEQNRDDVEAPDMYARMQ